MMPKGMLAREKWQPGGIGTQDLFEAIVSIYGVEGDSKGATEILVASICREIKSN